jgi:hypothetical protein
LTALVPTSMPIRQSRAMLVGPSQFQGQLRFNFPKLDQPLAHR